MHLTKPRIFGLDLLRAIAILSVVFSHTAYFLKPLGQVHFIGPVVYKFIWFVAPLGQLGVELFFVLSGFLIGGLLIKTFITAPNFNGIEVRNFLVRRWFRTLPNYWLILTVNIILYCVSGLLNFHPYQLLYYFFLQNLWLPHPEAFFGEAWSLAVEEWFYLILPCCIYIAYRICKPNNKGKFLLRLLLWLVVLPAIIRFVNAFNPINSAFSEDMGIRKVVLFRLDALLYGVMMAYLVYFKKKFINRIKTYLLFIGTFGAIAIYHLISNQGLDITHTTVPVLKFLSDAFLYLIISCLLLVIPAFC
jgi:peptidoglycan/LPS O-acetylase OafA/YrhL